MNQHSRRLSHARRSQYAYQVSRLISFLEAVLQSLQVLIPSSLPRDVLVMRSLAISRPLFQFLQRLLQSRAILLEFSVILRENVPQVFDVRELVLYFGLAVVGFGDKSLELLNENM